MSDNRRLANKLIDKFGDNIKLTFVYKTDFDIKVIIVTRDDSVYEFHINIGVNLSFTPICCLRLIERA